MRRLLTTTLLLLAAPAAPADALPADARITTAGLGPVRIGMSVRAVERAAHRETGLRPRRGRCDQAAIGRRVTAMFTGSRLVRIDVRTRRYATASGVRVGHAQRRVHDVYGGRIRSQPHKYIPGWRYLRYTDGNRRVVFETDGERVRTISTGRIPEIDYVENCG